MRKIWFLALAAGIVALTVESVSAQRPGGGRGFGGGGFQLLANKSVQEELKLSDAQKEKIEAKAKDYRSKMQDVFAKLKDVPKDERREKMTSLMKEANAEADKAAAEILKPDQMKRFRQIERQQQGITSLTSEDTAKELKLSDTQKEKLKAINEELSNDMRELFKGGGGKDARAKITALRKEAMDKAVAVLNADQKTKWKEMTGAPFEVRFEPRPKKE